MIPVQLSQLFIYPVKSLAGIAVDQVEVTDRGLAGDREWMIVDHAGRFVTQRQLPQLATIQVAPVDGGLNLTQTDAGSLFIQTPTPNSPTREVRVWNDNCRAQTTNPEVSQWLAEALSYKHQLTLVKFAPEFTRPGDPERFCDATTRFADAAPFLVANQASLDALNECLQDQGAAPVDIRRFRPNLVIQGAASFAEQRMGQLKHKDSPLLWELCDLCQRCSIITVDPDTGTRTPKAIPFNQLATLNPMPGKPGAPAFGINARLLAGAGTVIRTGSNMLLSSS